MSESDMQVDENANISNVSRRSSVPSNDQILSEIKKLLQAKSTYRSFKKLFQLVPISCIPFNLSVKIMSFALNKRRTPRIKLLLFTWIAGLLETELINFEAVNLFYYCLLNMTIREPHSSLIGWVCKCLYLLTRRAIDVTQLAVTIIKKAFSRHQNNCEQALLALFKALRPDLVPDIVTNFTIDQAFPKYPPDFRLRLDKITLKQDLQLKTAIAKSKKSRKSLKSWIPEIDIVNLESFYQRNLVEKSIYEYNSVHEIATEDWNKTTLANFVSLCTTEAGIHFVTFAESSFRQRALLYLKNSLLAEFRNSTINSMENERNLIKIVNDLSEYSQEGFPELNRIIIEYFSYCRQKMLDPLLLNLFTWQSSMEFPIFLKYFLKPLKSVFILEYRIERQWEIIDCFEQLIINYVTCHLDKDSQDNEETMTTRKQSSVSEKQLELMENLINWLHGFANECLLLDKPSLIFCMLDLYHCIAYLKTRYKLWTKNFILPKDFARACITSKNMACINRFANLINVYFNDFNEEDLEKLNKYALELCKALVGNYMGDVPVEDEMMSLNWHPGVRPFFLDQLQDTEDEKEVYRAALHFCKTQYTDCYTLLQYIFDL